MKDKDKVVKPKHNIGDKLWWAKTESDTKYIKCPDCFGKRFLTVILGDNSQVTIPCAGCSKGFDPPTGYISYYSYQQSVEKVEIDGVENRKGEEIKYQVKAGNGCWYNIKEKNLSKRKEKAKEKAKQLARERSDKAFKELQGKERDKRTWAWNVHWYRKQIREAKETIARYEKKLEYAKYIKQDTPDET